MNDVVHMYMRFATQRVEPGDMDRSAGFLTKSNRQYLKGEWDPSGDASGPTPSQESSKRTEIKARTRHALADFALLQSEADEDLKTGVINLDVDPPLFPDDAPDHFIRGLLRFASDAATNEEISDYLFEEVGFGDYGDIDEESSTALQYAAAGNKEMYLRAHFTRWAEQAAEAGISKEEAINALERSWPA